MPLSRRSMIRSPSPQMIARAAAEQDPSPTVLTRSPEPEVVVLEPRTDADLDTVAALAQRAQEESDTLEEDYDPWESFNEKMFTVNRNLDRFILKPVARAYRVVMPEPWQVLIANGFDNSNGGANLAQDLGAVQVDAGSLGCQG